MEQINLAESKVYNMAYQSFCKEVRVEQESFKKIVDSKFMKHFYSEQERQDYQKKWVMRQE